MAMDLSVAQSIARQVKAPDSPDGLDDIERVARARSCSRVKAAYLIADAAKVLDAESKPLPVRLLEFIETYATGEGRTIPLSEAFAREILAAIPAWQPIETAPRDGTRFLAFSPFGSQNMDIVSWDGEADSWADFSGAWWPDGDLSHWQPLPEPPKEKES